MTTAHRHAKADICRDLLKLATDPQVIEQLQLWIADLETDAARVRGRAATSDDRVSMPGTRNASVR